MFPRPEQLRAMIQRAAKDSGLTFANPTELRRFVESRAKAAEQQFHGAMAEIIVDGVSGKLFRPGDPDDLAAALEWGASHPQEMDRIGRTARREFELKYTAASNHDALMEIYERVGRRKAA